MSEEGLSKNEQTPVPEDSCRIDKRYLPRWTVNQRVLYQKESEPTYQECRSRDIHSEGACICPIEELPIDQKLNLTIYLPGDIAIHVQGKVLWVQNYAQQKLAGLRFDNVTQKDQDMILQQAFNCNKEAMIKHWFQGW